MLQNKILPLLKSHIMEMILLLLCAILAFKAENFFSTDNLLNVLRNVSMQGIIAFGMTMVIISGEIDLSIGSAVAFSGCITAYVTKVLASNGVVMPFAILIAIVSAIMIGLLVGTFTGFIRMRFQVPSFITTLAWMTALSGAAELITNGFPLTPFPEWYNFIGGGYLYGIPFPAIVFIFVFFIAHFVMNYTSFGRAVYAIGGNMEVARLSGIRVQSIKMSVMAIVASLAALSGVMQSSEIMSGSPTTAKGWELDIISAVIIGGTSLMGGSGTVKGTLIGIVFLGVLVNGMTLINVNEYWQHVVRGVLILLAVLINRMQLNSNSSEGVHSDK